jgi:carbonic anhydrase
MHRCVTFVLAFALSLSLTAQEKPLEACALWNMMHDGNRTFVAGDISFTDLDQERKALVGGQRPPVLVLACSDSRVPPELVFNQSLGALFVVRTAGNVVDEIGLASIEYAVSQNPQWTKLIVVLGHENCGAVEAAMAEDNPAKPLTPSLMALVARIRGSFIMGQTDLPDATRANAYASAAYLTAQSPVIRDAVARRRVTIIPAYYSLTTGVVAQIGNACPPPPPPPPKK